MLRRLALLAVTLLSPTAARPADADVFVEFWARSGSLPPPYAWSLSVTIRQDGHLISRHCKGYATEGPDCTVREAAVDDSGLIAIRAAVDASGLVGAPARSTDNIPVGGGSRGGVVHVNGQAVDLPPFPVEADVNRVRSVLDMIARIVPDSPQ